MSVGEPPTGRHTHDLARCIMRVVRSHVQRGHVSAATLRTLSLFIALGALPYAARGDWTLGAEASLRHDNNVGNAESPNIVADSAIGARLSIFQLFPVGESYSVTVGADLGGEAYYKLTGLNNASIDAVFALKKKWGLGAFVPWARVGVSVGRLSYDASYRNAWNYRATLASGRRIDERWNLWAEYAFERRAAKTQEDEVPGLSGDAYSQHSHNIGANLEYALSERAFLALGLLARHGDVVSTTGPGPQILFASQALAEDPAFGPGFYAYRLTGTSYGFRMGINYAPTQHSLLGCGFERLETHAYEDNSYTKSVPEITWDYRF
jgi:hypothetical protein